MQIQVRRAVVFACVVLALGRGHAIASPNAATHWKGVNPDMLSGGLFAAIDAEGAFGAPLPPARARASYPDAAKGRPPALLAPRVGRNIRLGDDPDALAAGLRGQAEPHIVRSPVNPELLLATFQEGRMFDSGATACGYSVSQDGGFTWTRALTPRLTTASGGPFNRATDPVAGAGPQGDLYLQALASVQGAFELAAVVVSRSTDSGATWGGPVTVFQSPSVLIFPDKNWLAVNDFPSAPNAGRLVSTWTQFTRNAVGTTIGIPIVASVSDDRGATWSPPISVTPLQSSNQGSQPVFLPDGSLVVVYVTFLNANDTRQFNILCKRSADGGRTYPDTATTIVPLVNGWDDPDLRDGVFLPCAAVERITGEIFVTYTAMVSGTPRVMLTSSKDRGATWSTPLVISDQPAGVSVMTPAVVAHPGAVVVVFLDKRNAPDGRNFVDLYAAISNRDQWLPNVRVTSMSSDIRLAAPTSRGYMLGDYLGIAPGNSGLSPAVAIWCDTRSGDADPFVARITPAFVYPIGASQIPDYSDWTMARLPSGGRAPAADPDPDHDGANNFVEFALGTDPMTPEYGDTLVLARQTGDALDVAWVGREDMQLEAGIEATVLLPDGTRSSTVYAGAEGASFLPNTAALPGGTWKTARITGPLQGQPVSLARKLEYGYFATVAATIRDRTPDGATSASNSRLINLSTRGQIQGTTSPMIAGFVLDGPKSMLVRAAGPTLSSFGVANALADPLLTLSAPASDLERTNDNWQQGEATAALFARVGAFAFPAGSRDAAVAMMLGPQSYSAIVGGANNTAGVALAEVYDADGIPGAVGNPRLKNLSTRGSVGAGTNALIAGFVLSGTQPRRVLIRAIGPSLDQFAVTNALADPVLTLFRGSSLVATNDDWELSRSGAAVAVTAQRVGAFPLNPASLDAALLLTLEPGAYTAVVSSGGTTSGVALVEIYDADSS